MTGIWLALGVGLLAGALAGIFATDWWHHRQRSWVDLERGGKIRIRRRFLFFGD